MAKIIKAVFGVGETTRVCPQWQYDYNTILQFVGLDLPTTFEVDLANSKTGQSTTVLGDADGCCTIPAQYFIPGTSIFAWAYIVDSNSGFTRCQVEIPISPRAQHTGDPPTPEQQSALDQAIALLNAATENIPNEIDSALTEAKESGEFDGEDGADGSNAWLIDVAYTSTVGTTIRAQTEHLIGPPNARPMYGDILFVSDGRFGNITSPGTRVILVSTLGDLHGDPGEDGYSPAVTITEITGGHRVTITDEAHPQGQSFDVMDGSGGSGSSDYTDLTNKPKIAGTTLTGNKSLSDLGIEPEAMIVTVTESSGHYSANKTFSQISSAVSANKRVVAVFGDVVYRLDKKDVIDAYFCAVDGTNLKTIVIAEDNTVYAVSRSLGTYSKPSGGIPASDLASAVQTSLGKADTALQSAPVTSVNGQTGAVTLSIPSTASDVGAVAVSQGVAHAGEFCVVGSDGNITTVTMSVWQGGSY